MLFFFKGIYYVNLHTKFKNFMESAIFSDLTLLEINQSLGLPINYYLLMHIDKYDNGV